MASLDLIQSLLAELPGFKLVADGRQLLGRCSICGDSPNPSSAHFYIGPLKDETKPLQYHCKKCEAFGLFDAAFLRENGIYDMELGMLLNDYNKRILNNPNYAALYNVSKGIYRLNNAYITDDAISQTKLRYINDRLGVNLTYQDMLSNKIVLNIKDLLWSNNIVNLTRHPNIIEQLNTYFIGFISYDNCFVNMRRVCEEGKVFESIDKRYINYNIFNKTDNSMRFYVPPVAIDILDPSPIHVYITEGPFDILSVKYNIDSGNRCIYMSVGGKSYLTAVKFVLGYLGIINAVIHLCPDKDVDDYAMYTINNYVAPFNLNVNSLRNTYPGEKDFGVPLPNIKVEVTSLNKGGSYNGE